MSRDATKIVKFIVPRSGAQVLDRVQYGHTVKMYSFVEKSSS